MHCPECGSKNTIKDYRDIPFTYKGQSTVVKAVGADWCLDCGEGVIFKEESLRIDSILTEFNKQVNASIIDPEYVLLTFLFRRLSLSAWATMLPNTHTVCNFIISQLLSSSR